MDIKEFIYENGMSVRELASMLGVTPTYLSSVITGRSKAGGRLKYNINKIIESNKLPVINNEKDK